MGMVLVIAVAITKPINKQMTIHFVLRIFLYNKVSISLSSFLNQISLKIGLSDDNLIAHLKTGDDFNRRTAL